ncbi:hypothetical protein F5Y00DRAFT_70932 [Daldinia vernicosa]|uniref:uncharacterized protein n=1 Tax=Daldinia vernicosa TaxID=114800 RepID=UPI0020088EC1|nr:uncharacterized protein F5Y00DRAFT_70932 [Daldinia vernicosa]KAI0849288.1 hypothetical protein F5Y00DRAFT_70932 [Daldinia vernicosa]
MRTNSLPHPFPYLVAIFYFLFALLFACNILANCCADSGFLTCSTHVSRPDPLSSAATKLTVFSLALYSTSGRMALFIAMWPRGSARSNTRTVPLVLFLRTRSGPTP